MRSSTIRLTLLVAFATVLLLAATACGSKKSSSSASSATTPTTTTDTSGSSSGSSTSNGTSTSTNSTSTTSSSGGTGGSTNISKSCLNFAGAASKLGQALATGGSQAADSGNLKKYFQGLAAKAPSDIKSSFQTLADAMGKYLDGIKGLNLKPGQTPSAGDLAKLQSAGAALSKPEVQAASTKISAWVKAGCHS